MTVTINSDPATGFINSVVLVEAEAGQADMQSNANVMLSTSADTCSIVGSIGGLVNDVSASATRVTSAAIQAAFNEVALATKKTNEVIASSKSKIVSAINAKTKSLRDQLGGEDDGGILSQIADIIARAKAAIEPIVTTIGNAVVAVKNAVVTAATAASNAITALTNRLVTAVQDLNAALCAGTADVLGSVGSGITGAANRLATPLEQGLSPRDAVKSVNSAGVASDANSATQSNDSAAAGVSNASTALDTNFVEQLDTAIAGA